MFLEGLEEGIRLGRMLGIQEILESLNKEIEKSIVPDKN